LDLIRLVPGTAVLSESTGCIPQFLQEKRTTKRTAEVKKAPVSKKYLAE
jgi:hypothetical protein